MSLYRYPPLHQDAPSVRLISLIRSGDQSSMLRCKFKLAYLGGDSWYDAVSYAWETKTRNRPIRIDDQTFLVSPIVEDLLMRLREPERDRLLWLDLICIDQGNLDERSRQVGRMKDIFSQAQTVIVSLGPHIGSKHRTNPRSVPPDYQDLGRPPLRIVQGASRVLSEAEMPSYRQEYAEMLKDDLNTDGQRRSDVAFKLLKSIWSAVGGVTNFPLSDTDARDILFLLSKPWFSRVWVVQEVAAARKLVIICGKQTVDGKQFAKFLFKRIHSRVRQDCLRVKLENLRPLLFYMSVDPATEPKKELLTLLHQFRSWEATDPRDRVYALLGLSSDDCGSSKLQPNYELPVTQVYQNVVEYMLARYNSLAVLTYAMPKKELPQPEPGGWTSWMWKPFQGATNAPNLREIPSWCPDWRDAYTSWSSPPELPSTPFTQTRRSLSLVWSIESGVLKVPGYLLGRVTSILDNGDIEAISSNEIRDVLEWPFTAVSRHLQNTSVALHKATGHGLDIGDRLCILHGSTGLAILRPRDGRFHLVVLEHSNFGRILSGFSSESFWQIVASVPALQESVFTGIARELTSRTDFDLGIVGKMTGRAEFDRRRDLDLRKRVAIQKFELI